MNIWQASIRGSSLSRRLRQVAALAASLTLALLVAGCGGGTGGSTSASPSLSSSATSQSSVLPDTQSKADAPLLTDGTYKAELGGKLPNGTRDIVDWFKVRLSGGQGVVGLKVTLAESATYYVEIQTPDGTVVSKSTFAGPQFGVEAPTGTGLFYIRLEDVQGKGPYTIELTLH